MTDRTGNGAVEHGGGLTAARARYGGRESDWLDLSTGINPVAAVLPAIDPVVWRRLPDVELFRGAGEAAAQRYGTPSGVVPLPVAGVQNAVQMLPAVMDGPVAVLSPTYEEYRHCFGRDGRRVDPIDDLDGVGRHHRVVVVVNPNNPDGRIVAPEELLLLADDLAARGGYLIVDEAFADTRPEISVAPHAGRAPGLIVLRSFGKFFGLAGLRLGFVIAAAPVRQTLMRLQGPWPVSGPALAVARTLLADEDAVRAVGERIAERRRALTAVLDGAGLTIAGATDLFALIDHARAEDVHAHLCRSHILTRRFGYAPRWLRFGLCPDAAGDARLLRALAEAM